MNDKTPTSVELLDRARAAIARRDGLPAPVSDYRVSQELGIGRGAVSAIRKGSTTWGAPATEKLAEILGVSPLWLLTIVQAERSTQNDRVRELWMQAARKLAVVFIAVGVLYVAIPVYIAPGAANAHCILCPLGALVLSWLLSQYRRSRWVLVGAALALSGCAAAPSLPDNPFQVRAAELIAGYNARHGTHLPVPAVYLWSPTAPFQASTACSRQPRLCTIEVSPELAAQDPDYVMANTLPHELAHVVVCERSPDACRIDDHGPAWQAAAVEFGLSRLDSYVSDPSLRAGIP